MFDSMMYSIQQRPFSSNSGIPQSATKILPNILRTTAVSPTCPFCDVLCAGAGRLTCCRANRVSRLAVMIRVGAISFHQCSRIRVRDVSEEPFSILGLSQQRNPSRSLRRISRSTRGFGCMLLTHWNHIRVRTVLGITSRQIKHDQA